MYNAQTDEPYYVRYSYAFEGLSDTLTAGQIIEACRNAEDTSTSTPLPLPDENEVGLPQTRVDVRRYSRQTGQARIVVEWGIRSFSGGQAPDVVSERSETSSTSYTQPFAISFAQVGPIPRNQSEIATRTVSRPRLRTTIRRLKTESGGLGDQISQDIANNVGRLMVWRNLDRIIVGGGFQPTTQTQGYAYIVLDYLPPLDAVAAGDIYSEAGYENLPIEALTANQVYKIPPNFTTGTQGESLDVTYRGSTLGTFGWILQ